MFSFVCGDTCQTWRARAGKVFTAVNLAKAHVGQPDRTSAVRRARANEPARSGSDHTSAEYVMELPIFSGLEVATRGQLPRRITENGPPGADDDESCSGQISWCCMTERVAA